jgi:hypothetical protein
VANSSRADGLASRRGKRPPEVKNTEPGRFTVTDVSRHPIVELRGLEPLTPTLPVWCATSCATAPNYF